MSDDLDWLKSNPELRAQTAFTSAIGHVCLQWSLLELTLLSYLCVLEGCLPEKGDLIFGGLDMLGRINSAISLSRYQNIPAPLIKELEAIRKSLQKGKLADRRNQAVHGAHAAGGTLGTYNLLMSRWKGERKVQPVSIADLVDLARSLHQLQVRAYDVIEAYGDWAFGPADQVTAR